MPQDPVGDAVQAVEDDAKKTLKADVLLTDGRRLVIVVPHPFSADDFESAVVTLLNMRASSEAQVKAEAHHGLTLLDDVPKLVDPRGNRLA